MSECIFCSPDRSREESRAASLTYFDQEACSPRVVELFGYWDARRGSRAMPRRQDIDPAEFVSHLPHVMLVDIEGLEASGVGIFRYRVVGTGEVDLRGHDPTGKLVRDAFFGPNVEDVIDCYEHVRRSRSYLIDPGKCISREGTFSNNVTLFLPLSEDGETVSQILVFADPNLHYETAPSWLSLAWKMSIFLNKATRESIRQDHLEVINGR